MWQAGVSNSRLRTVIFCSRRLKPSPTKPELAAADFDANETSPEKTGLTFGHIPRVSTEHCDARIGQFVWHRTESRPRRFYSLLFEVLVLSAAFERAA